MKNVSKIALAVFAAVGLAACGSNNGSSVEHFATYSKTEQGKKDFEALKNNGTKAATNENINNKGADQNGKLVVGSKTDAADHKYAQFGVFREGVTNESLGKLRYSVISTADNQLDAASALAVLSAKDNKGQYKNPGIDANYTGEFAYSAKEQADDKLALKVSTAKFTLKNDEIHGHTEGGAETFYFENAKVFNNGGELAYTGDVTVIKDNAIIDEGKYTGIFAGTAPANAKVGYDKDSVKAALDNIAGKVDTKAFEGAFDGKKQ